MNEIGSFIILTVIFFRVISQHQWRESIAVHPATYWSREISSPCNIDTYTIDCHEEDGMFYFLSSTEYNNFVHSGSIAGELDSQTIPEGGSEYTFPEKLKDYHHYYIVEKNDASGIVYCNIEYLCSENITNGTTFGMKVGIFILCVLGLCCVCCCCVVCVVLGLCACSSAIWTCYYARRGTKDEKTPLLEKEEGSSKGKKERKRNDEDEKKKLLEDDEEDEEDDDKEVMEFLKEKKETERIVVDEIVFEKKEEEKKEDEEEKLLEKKKEGNEDDEKVNKGNVGNEIDLSQIIKRENKKISTLKNQLN